MTTEQILLLCGVLLFSFGFWATQKRKEREALKGKTILKNIEDGWR